jgi:hypothetical protein
MPQGLALDGAVIVNNGTSDILPFTRRDLSNSQSEIITTFGPGYKAIIIIVDPRWYVSSSDEIQGVIETWIDSQDLRPIAVAGPSQRANRGQVVYLDGSGSNSPYGISTYKWEHVTGDIGVPVEISNSNSPIASFIYPDCPPAGSCYHLIFQLTVNDNIYQQTADSCEVHLNHPPIANAGPDQTIGEKGYNIQLDGSLSGDDYDLISTYSWRQISGTDVALVNSGTSKPSFKTPETSHFVNCFETLVFELTVTDDLGLQGTDTVQVELYEECYLFGCCTEDCQCTEGCACISQ